MHGGQHSRGGRRIHGLQRPGRHPGIRQFDSAGRQLDRPQLLYLIRGPRCATVLASEEKVTFRGLLFTRSWRWEQIDRFIVDARPVVVPLTFFTQRRRVMGIRTREGKSIWFTEISRRYAIGQPNVIDDHVNRLNEMLASKRAD